ncbi:hypothetical protein AB0D83_38455 [Streptomyces decoyicus]|uniref:hypothetical protein n=1 Tax=Streptomyces decoyicus TaxID=249567 RepID=UPI0033C28881
MLNSHSKPLHTRAFDPLDLFNGFGLAMAITGNTTRPRAFVSAGSGVALVDATISRVGEDHLRFAIPNVSEEARVLPRELADALSTQEFLMLLPNKEVHARATGRLTANTLLLPRSDRWQEAVSTALLGSWSEPLWTEGHLPPTAIGALKAEARRQHRQLVPLWRRRTRHGRVLSLDATLGDGLSLYDLVAADLDLLPRVAGGVFEDERLNAVLRCLAPTERQVVLAYAEGEGTTWSEAATVAGATDPKALGDHVRRKAQRLAAEQRRRLTQMRRRTPADAAGQVRDTSRWS